MIDERHETVSDIMSEMRKYADSMEQHDLYDLRECATDYLRVLADRIEDAVNRENRTVEKSSAVVNTSAMLEALEKTQSVIATCMEILNKIPDGCDYDGLVDEVSDELCDLLYSHVKAALHSPPRNCDVGTAEEQAKRFKSFCKTHLSGIRSICSPQCPCVCCRSMFHCLTKWAQMPYEEVK